MEPEKILTREQRRSRSKTPLTLRSSVDRDIEVDGEKKKVKKNPTVETITEESPAPVVTQRSTRTKRNTAKTTSSAVDASEANIINKETVALIANSIAVVPQAIAATEQTVTKTTTVITSKTIKSNTGESLLHEKQHQSQTVTKSNAAATRSRETNQNESNLLLEHNAKLKTSTPRAKVRDINNTSNSSSNNSLNSSITNGINLDELAAYKEYKEAGEYWNKFPKTDYTYSKLSQHRREVAPGSINMPNMSRRSLDHHQQRVNDMVRLDPTQESFFRSRYNSLTSSRQRFAADNYYDSGDEVDRAFGYQRIQTQSIFRRFITWLNVLFTSVYNYCFRGSSKTERNYTFHRDQSYPDKRGFFTRIWSGILNTIYSFFCYIYFGIASVLIADTKLTSNKIDDHVAQRRRKRRFFIGLLILLPLLLLAAWNLSEESDRVFYRQKFSDSLTTITSYTNLPDSAYETIDEISLRTSKVIPIGMSMIRTQTSHLNDRFWSFLDWNWWPIFNRNQQITNSIKASLSPDEYKNVLKHIDAYIETVINQKIQNFEGERAQRETIIDDKLAAYIATIVKEQIIIYKYTLTNEDIERIAEVVREKLAPELNKEPKVLPFVLSQENLEEITKIVKKNIEIHQHEWIITQNDKTTPDATNIDIDEILFKILSSSKLENLVDKQINGKLSNLNGQLNDHQITLDQLQNDVNDLKEKSHTLFNADNDIKLTIDQLKVQHTDLDDRIKLTQYQNNEKLTKFMEEINIKLNNLNDNQFNSINNHIRIVLADIMGYKLADGKSLENVDITNWIRSLFVAKELLEERLAELSAKFDNKINDEINRSAEILIKNISDTIKHDIAIAIEEKQRKIQETTITHNIHTSLDETRIRAIIKETLAIYDADKTGMVDYALESAGGEILSTRCTESFNVKSAEISIFGVPLWYKSNTPRTVISPSVQPGECWSFQGFPGYLVLKLNNNVFVTGFTLEHIPKNLAPNGRIDSAPKLFTVWGLETMNDGEPHQFGEYEYLENGTSLQYFPVENYDSQIARSHNIVELRIESNHGNNNYTCLYRFRVHGTLTPSLS